MSNNKNKILTELPRKEGFGKNKNKKVFDYQAMVGMKLELEYEQEIYIVEIIDYIKGNPARFKIKYNGEIKEIACGDFMYGKFGGILNKFTKSFKFKIGDEIKDEGRDIVIIDREYRERKHTSGKWVKNEKWYKYRCNKCGWDEGWVVESALLKQKVGCSCCSNQTVVEDINSIWITDRWMCDLGLSEEDAKTHTKSSGKKVFVICPKCNKKKEMRISHIYNYKTIWCSCSDKKSYPEKFMTSVLDQLGVEYQTQYQPEYLNRLEEDGEWSQKKSDFYLPEYGLIIETDGKLNHEGGKLHSKSKKPLEYYVEVDNWKDEQHLLHGLETTRIDCFKSDMKYIKNNILNSELNKIFDLSKIDWLKCEEFALCNLVKSVCDYWNNDKKDWETTADLGKIFKISRDSIVDYLKKGTELGWCNYSGKEEQEKGRRKSTNGKVVAMYDLEGNFIMKESSTCKLKERCLKELNIDLKTSAISDVCLGKRKTHKGYIFKYID